MCDKIESPFILIHALRDKQSLTMTDIVEIKRNIERENPSVYVDVSKSSILETISFYPEIFSWENNHIKRKETADNYFQDDVIGCFGSIDIDKSLESKIIQCIEN